MPCSERRTADRGLNLGQVPRTARSGLVDLVQLLAAVEAARDVERLALRAHGRRVGGEVTGRGDEEDRVAGKRELAERRLDALDRVEVAVLAEERAAERRLERRGIAARGEVGGDEPARLVHLLLMVEEGEQLSGVGRRRRPAPEAARPVR